MRRTTFKLLLCILFGVFFCVPESPPARIQSSQLVTMIHPLKTHALKGRYQPAELHGASLLIGKTTMVGPPAWTAASLPARPRQHLSDPSTTVTRCRPADLDEAGAVPATPAATYSIGKRHRRQPSADLRADQAPDKPDSKAVSRPAFPRPSTGPELCQNWPAVSLRSGHATGHPCGLRRNRGPRRTHCADGPAAHCRGLQAPCGTDRPGPSWRPGRLASGAACRTVC